MRHQREREKKTQSNPNARIPEGAGTPLPRKMGLCPSSGCSREGIPAVHPALFPGKTQICASSWRNRSCLQHFQNYPSLLLHLGISSTRTGWGKFTFPESRKNLQVLEALPWDSQQNLLHWFEPFPEFPDPWDAFFFPKEFNGTLNY